MGVLFGEELHGQTHGDSPENGGGQVLVVPTVAALSGIDRFFCHPDQGTSPHGSCEGPEPIALGGLFCNSGPGQAKETASNEMEGLVPFCLSMGMGADHKKHEGEKQWSHRG